MKLALFDLDHTLIPYDSGLAWTRFLSARGVLPADAEAAYIRECRGYAAGTLDIHALHRAAVAPLSPHEPADIRRWGDEFEAQVTPGLPPAMRQRVDRHRRQGDLCAIVTATTRFVAEPFARAFGIEHLLATEPARGADGRYDGEIDGLPCFREHKVDHVARWLAGRADPAQRCIGGFATSCFYSDSYNDLPLLRTVAEPIAVRPDARLRAHAVEQGWAVVDDR